MKTKLIAILLFSGLALFAQSNDIPELPATPSSADAPWSDSQCFWAGVTLGFTWGGVAWIFRLVRQPARQNPEL